MFWTRLLSGVILVIIALFTMSFGQLPLLLVLYGISISGYRELTKALQCATDTKKMNSLEGVGVVGITAYYAMVFCSTKIEILLLTIVGVFMLHMFVYVITFPMFQIEQVMSSIFAFLYAPLMLSFIYLTRESEQGIYAVWMILISSWGCDTCAYAVGKLIGRKKIFPVLSPNKSLEGCIGGILGSALIGGIYANFFIQPALLEGVNVWIVAFICAIGAIMSMVGDLAASAIKRNHNIKDYGNLIPGHGGIMDRFDSVIVTAPMIYFLTIMMIHF